MTPAPRGSLLVRAAGGFLWAGGAQMLGQTLHIVIRLILARLLVPQDFGLLAMATSFLGITALLADLGIGSALTQQRELTPQHRSTAFWLTFAMASGFFVLFFAAAPLVGAFYREGSVVPVLRVLTLSFFLGVPESVYTALLVRRLDFKTLGLRQIAATAVGGGAGIAAALSGLGVWSLVLHTLVTTATSSTLLVLQAGWLPGWTISRSAARELWGFGRWVTGNRFLNYFNRNADNLLIGRFLGAGTLGLYSFSYQAVLLPLMYVARPVAAVSFPSFVHLRDDRPRCARAYLRTLEMIAVITAPLVALGVAASPAAIPQVVGETWMPAVPIVQLLSGVAAFHALMNLASPLFDGLGRPQWGFLWTAFTLVLNLTAFLVGLRWGAVGVAAGLLCAASIQLPCQWLLVRRLLPLPGISLASLLARGLLLFLATVAVWELLASWLSPDQTLTRLVGCGFATGALAIGGAALLFPQAYDSLRQALRGLIRQRQEAS